jgi:type IV pilus assembly protein PilB
MYKLLVEMQLGEILLQKGYVHPEQVTEALELQKIKPHRLGEVLLDLGYVEEEHILEALSEQFGIPIELDLLQQGDMSLITKVPINFIREYFMVPFKKNGEGFLVALNDPINLLPLMTFGYFWEDLYSLSYVVGQMFKDC